MKTGKHFYDQLPTDIQEKFKANCLRQTGGRAFNLMMGYACDNMGRFLKIAFNWESSIEGEAFWYEIYNKVAKFDYSKLIPEITEQPPSASTPSSSTPSAFWTGFATGVIALAVLCMALIWWAL